MLTTALPTALNLDQAAGNLLELGYTRLICPSLPPRFPKLVVEFAEISEDGRRKLLVIPHLREQHADGTNDLGFREVRRGNIKKNPRTDEIAEGRTKYDETKFVLHFNARALGYWSGHDAEELLREHEQFFFELSLVQSESMLIGYEIAERFDHLLPGYGFVKRMHEAEYLARLRLLRYLCDGVEPSIAQRHRDQCFLTIHIRSDRPGLWLANKDHTQIIEDAQETREDSVLIFLGRKAWEITNGKLDGIIHGVLDPTFGEAGRTPRHTAVSFLHATVRDEEQGWGTNNIHQLVIPQHVSDYGLRITA